jgi:hypothetical protein
MAERTERTPTKQARPHIQMEPTPRGLKNPVVKIIMEALAFFGLCMVVYFIWISL